MPAGRGYQMRDGRYADVEPMELLPEALITATGNGPPFEMGGRSSLRLTFNVASVSGTSPTLDVTIQTSADGIIWRGLQTLTPATAPGSERRSFGGADRFVRVAYLLAGSGSPAFTASVGGEAV